MTYQIESYLRTNCRGRMKAMKAQVIAERFGISLREINETIRILRTEGFIIGSAKIAPHGYYVPANDQEAEDCIKTDRSEVIAMLQVLNRMKRAIRERFAAGKQYEIKF